MKVIDVYLQYFEGSCVCFGAERRGAVVKLTAASDAGEIAYTASVGFFLHVEPTDFRIAYDVYEERELYRARGRRSKKREAALLEELRPCADELAAALGGAVLWDKPLIEARLG